jgi:hypothetical protein
MRLYAAPLCTMCPILGSSIIRDFRRSELVDDESNVNIVAADTELAAKNIAIVIIMLLIFILNLLV